VTPYDCFFDVDGENLTERLLRLAQRATEAGRPILFK
jgi:hypothetical protein